jgi:hypothetical protein|tara:strand:- start:7674 stop:8375 length:702 start_codon:yes stop_codon:yes gene_type:complete
MGKFSMHDDIKLKETSLGGGSYLWDSGVYKTIVDMAYFDQSKGGAHSLNVTLLGEDGKKLKQTIWFTNRKEEVHFVNQKGEKDYLPGYTLVNNLALIITGEDINEAFDKSEKKMVNVYDFNEKKEKPTEKSVATSLLGKQIKAAVLKQTVNKRVNDGSGTYVDSAETRDENQLKEFYFPDSDLTVVEKAKDATEALMMPKWAERNTGKTLNRVKEVTGSTSAAAKPAGKKLFN